MTTWSKLGSEQKNSFVKNTILKALYSAYKDNESKVSIEDHKLETTASLAEAVRLEALSRYSEGHVPSEATLINGYISPALGNLARQELVSSLGVNRKKYSITEKGIAYMRNNNLIADEASVTEIALEPTTPVVPTEPMLKLTEKPDSFIKEALGHALARAATPAEIADRNQAVFQKYR